jgi:hypothetical protein
MRLTNATAGLWFGGPSFGAYIPPESADSGLDRSDRRENAPKTGKIVKIAGFGATEGPMEGSAGLQNQVSSAI